MTAIVFPATPTANQIFTASSGSKWVWDGVSWRVFGAAMPTATTIVDGYLNHTDWTTFNGKVTFPGFGTSSTTACVGNDSRLSDARISNIAASTTGNVLTSNGTVWTSAAPAITTASNLTWTRAQRGAVVALTDASPVVVDLALSNNFSLLMTSGIGTRQLQNPTNIVAGQSGILAVTQDASGSRLLTYGTFYKFVGGTPPVLSTGANAVDYLSYYVESASRVFVSILKDVK